MMGTIHTVWQGERALTEVFWTWAVTGGVIVNGFSSGLFFFLITIDQPVAALIVGYVPTIPYNVLVTVGVWRSAGRYAGPRHWADLARGVTVLGMVLLSAT